MNTVSVGQEWQFDSGAFRTGPKRFRIDAIGPRFADVTYCHNGHKGQVELRILRRGLRHAKPVAP